MAKPKVLIVEDIDTYQRYYRDSLEKQVEIIPATTVSDGEKFFSQHPDIALVIMDACVPGNEPNTVPLVQKIREAFTGPIIAASGLWEYRKILLTNGASHESEKIEVPALVKRLLNL